MKKVLIPLAVLSMATQANANIFEDLFSKPDPKKEYLESVKKSFTSELKTGDISILADNDDAFEAKIKAVESAKKSIDMIYYIYSEDQSADYFSKKLLEAAARGVKVRILLDYHSAYKHLDMLSALETETNGKIQVRLFNRPTRNVVKDAFYLTTSCDETPLAKCSDYKRKKIAKAFKGETINGKSAEKLDISNLNNGFSGTLISGIYSKDVDMIAYAIQTGQKLDLEKMKGEGGETTEEDKKQLKELLELYIDTKIGSTRSKLAAKVKLGIASLMYGEKVTSIVNMLNAYTPFGNKSSGDRSNDWDFLTDYTHHKLLLVDGKKLVMGGRNIENSYHMKPNDMTDKYIFMDTDASFEIKEGNEKIEKSFEALWGFTQMTASMKEIRKHAPNDLLANKKIFAESCKSAESKMACVLQNFQTNGVSVSEREKSEIEKIYAGAEEFESQYSPSENTRKWEEKFIISPTKEMTVGYLENVPYKYGAFSGNQIRVYGRESRNGIGNVSKKAIHNVWEESIKYTCKTATAKNPQRIIFHNAYVFPNGEMMKMLGDMVDGTLKCGNVKLTILTNSVYTTDLKIINQLARYQFKPFFDYYEKARDSKNGAEIEYFEYLEPPSKAGQFSLHTKLTTFGDQTVVVGSANLDIRSYMMDTNNALFIHGAKDFVTEYTAYVDEILADKKLSQNITEYFKNATMESLKIEDEMIVAELNKKYSLDKKVSPELFKSIKDRIFNHIRKINSKLEKLYELKNNDNDHDKMKVKELIDDLNEGFKLI